jgi:adenylosuccinate lyase
MTDAARWDNPLVERYAGKEMAALWSPQKRHGLWRRLWVALAEAQMELELSGEDGQPRITPRQLEQLRAQVNDIDFDKAAAYEKRFRHDVMAHVHAYGDACPDARGIIHLGATSCFVTDNGDLIQMRDGLRLLRDQLVSVIDALATFAVQWHDLPTLGYTHFQPAQLTTVGKRATLWLYDLVLDLEEIEYRINTLKFRGVKGTTGTQASFLTLFHGDHQRVRLLDELVAKKMEFLDVHPVTGQTYTRKVDSQVLDTLSGLAQSCHKFGTDLRLLQHHHEVEEPFEKEQIGSSAMAYKRNPMRSERLCGLSRFVCNLAANAAQTASVQWLERTLDDSVNRRLTLPQAFLACDAMLRLYLNVASGLVVHPEVVAQSVARELPFMATETLLMHAVQRGGDRQQLHEIIRQHSLTAAAQVKAGGQNMLLALLKKETAFAGSDLDALCDSRQFVGRSPEQVQEFVEEFIAPIRRRFPHRCAKTVTVEV